MATTPIAPLVVERLVIWRDCDPAGIVYTPRFLDYVAEAVESWYRHVFGADWYGLRETRALGSPIVHASLDFRRPFRSGDALRLVVLVDDPGRSSMPFRVLGLNAAGETAFTARMVISLMDVATERPTPVPDDLREAIRAYRDACRAAGLG